MMSTAVVAGCIALLKERFKSDPRMQLGRFDVEITPQNTFHACITFGIPDSDAGVSYEGFGPTIDEAICDLQNRVINDARSIGTIG